MSTDERFDLLFRNQYGSEAVNMFLYYLESSETNDIDWINLCIDKIESNDLLYFILSESASRSIKSDSVERKFLEILFDTSETYSEPTRILAISSLPDVIRSPNIKVLTKLYDLLFSDKILVGNASSVSLQKYAEFAIDSIDWGSDTKNVCAIGEFAYRKIMERL